MQHNIDIVIDRGVELNALETKAGMAWHYILCRFCWVRNVISMHAYRPSEG